jgi:hypothetical protein
VEPLLHLGPISGMNALYLWLTLTDNDNPRIEDAVEQLIETMQHR